MESSLEQPGRGGRRRAIGLAFLAVWIPLVVVAIGSLMITHWAPLPAPAVDAGSASGALQSARAGGRSLVAVHLLDIDCGCSRRVSDRLLESDRPRDVHEVVVLVGEDAELARDLRVRGFSVEGETPASALQRFGEFAAPALAVLRADDGAVLYVGGYTGRKQGLDVRDLAVLDACLTGEPPAPLPILGCGATEALERSLDPLRLKG